MRRLWIINNLVRCAESTAYSIKSIFPDEQIIVAASIQEMQCYINSFQQELCIIVGGDGTWSRALMESNPEQLIGYFPAGTINQSLFELNQSSNMTAWFHWKVCKVFLGQVVSSHKHSSFFMMLGIGVEADAVQIVRPAIKRLLGQGAYIIALLERLLRPVRKNIIVQVGEKSWHTSQALILNGQYYAGRYQVTSLTHVFQPDYVLLIWKSSGRFNWMCGMIARMLQWKIYRLWIHEVKINGEELMINGKARVQIDGDPGPMLPLNLCHPVSRKIVIARHTA